jgi:squalene-hopene/tetraprenyl-beta-curcumene cyclase
MTVPLDSLDRAIKKTQNYLLKRQSPKGYWVGELESDVSVTADYIPMMRFMSVEIPERQRKVVNFLRATQLAEGGWSSYPGGASEVNVSVQAYLALKAAGIPAQEPFMQRARDSILAHGGVQRTHTFTKIMLAHLGQYPWQDLPTLPPELMLLPNWFPVNIYEFASWARATIVALTIVMTNRPVCSLPESQSIHELYVAADPEDSIGKSSQASRRSSSSGLFTWERFFLVVDRLLKRWERVPFKPGRARALKKAERWILDRQEADGGWGGIMLPWVYSLFALKSLGYANDYPAVAKALAGLEGFIVEDDTVLRLQPAVSPVWDTALALIALRDSGLPADHPAAEKAARWLLNEQVRAGGDWQVKNPHTEPGAWAFEFENDYYPDVDDSTMVPMALSLVRLPEDAKRIQAIDRGVRWTLSMQSSSGGWAAFDLNNNSEMLAHIPFADFMTPLDPSTADVTAHVVELMGRFKYSQDHPVMRKALNYLWAEQQDDGSWFGRWGVNYIYGTWSVLLALREAGQDMQQEKVRQAVAWLQAHQNADGGWGESCSSYEIPCPGGACPSTASQTAWAILGLLAAGEQESPVVDKGIQFLLDNQRSDGDWDEELFTGTGFPRAFYLKYHLYPIYFPLMALARFQNAIQARSRKNDESNA